MGGGRSAAFGAGLAGTAETLPAPVPALLADLQCVVLTAASWRSVLVSAIASNRHSCWRSSGSSVSLCFGSLASWALAAASSMAGALARLSEVGVDEWMASGARRDCESVCRASQMK